MNLSNEDLAALESFLSHSVPLGDSDYIHQRMHATFERRLRRIASDVPTAGELLDALDRPANKDQKYRILGNTVVRRVVQIALRSLITNTPPPIPLGVCSDVLKAAAAHVTAREPFDFLEAHTGEHPRVMDGGPLVWDEACRDRLPTRVFRDIVIDQFQEGPTSPTKGDVTRLLEGIQLLRELLPELSASALRHCHVIALVPPTGRWKNTASCSQFRISGTIFLSSELIANPWWAAEHIFHEALHHKLYDLRYGHSLLMQEVSQATDTDEKEPVRVESPWNMPGKKKANAWDTHRTLAAFHVYVHLAILAGVAERRFSGHDRSRMTPSRTAFDRAQYLGAQLRSQCWEELGPAGHYVVDVLTSILDAVDPAPPPKDARVHLLLDRYRRETKAVRNSAAKDDRRAELAQIAKEEVAATRMALRTIGASTTLAGFEEAIGCCDHFGEMFVEIRELIATALVHASPFAYGAQDLSAELKAMNIAFGDMVESSGARLANIDLVT